MSPLAPGEIVLDRASRSFALTHERSRTLKELFVSRGGGGAGAVAALDGVDLRIEPGEMVGYLGPNGAGKSTTLKMLTGILTPSAGEVRVCGLAPV